MLREETLDGILVPGPDSLHVEHALAGIEAGLPVLVEKPIARSLANAAKLCRLADERGTLLMTVANKRYSPPYRRAKRFVDEEPVTDPALFSGKFKMSEN
jgi:scyllo-inositol 2-dehydrogenase (NADP+)